MSLCSGFFSRAAELPERPALEVGGRTLTYAELARRSRTIAATVLEHAPATHKALVAVLGHRRPARLHAAQSEVSGGPQSDDARALGLSRDHH